MSYRFPIDYYDWALAVYHGLLFVLLGISTFLWARVLRQRRGQEGAGSHVGRKSMRASERAEAWLRTIKQELVVMIIAAISCAFVQGLSRLSTEKYPPLTSYHDVLTTVVSQALWGMPFLAVIQLLEAVASRVILEGKRCSGFDSEAEKADGDRRAKGDS